MSLVLLGQVTALRAQELIERATCKGHTFTVTQACVSPDGKVIASGGGDSRGGELKLWDARTGKQLAALPGYTNSLYALAFSPDGKRLAAAGIAPVQVWDVSTGKELFSSKATGDWETALAFSPDGARVAAAGWSGATVWEVPSGKVVASFQRPGYSTANHPLAFSRDLRTLAVSNYQEIELWDVSTGERRAFLSEQRGEVGRAVYTTDGKTLIAGSNLRVGKKEHNLGEVRLLDVATGRARATFSDGLGSPRALGFSPDGKTLAVLDYEDFVGEATLKLLDVATGRRRAAPAVPGHSFLSLAYTADGRLFVTGTADDNSVTLWEVVSDKRRDK
jgi:WD40 repeat protein